MSHITGSGTTPDADPEASTDRFDDGYRAAIIGTGFMGQVHSHAIRAAGGRVVGVAASTSDSARAARRNLGAERAFTDSRHLIDSDDVDVVHVCTPNHLHGPLAIAALNAGKHVVCEKPLSTDAATAAEMADAAQGAERVGTVPFVYRFHPMAREARDRVRRGTIGRVVLAHGSYLQDWLLRPGDDNWRVDPDLGGPLRAFGDIGSHWFDMVEFVTGDRITRLCAQTSTVNPSRGGGDGRPVGTEDLVTVQFALRGGAVGTSVISQVSAGRKNRLLLEVSGTEATLCFDQEQPEFLWQGERERSALLMRDPDTLSPDARRLARVPAGHPQGYQDCFNAFVADTRDAIAGEAPDGLPTFADGLRAAHMAEAVLESARTGTWAEVSG
ncbi:putative dehydrogenase [Lipingzhangella halophila]|uniref:Putative dehydrogenase n=1 Tax=Lipingzhangella halophila TaxID=1783352 RepID=A0A7W7RMN8_9ACTN|nr:putative dehydrogenase [Lipingzhangella halophila]